MFTPIQGLDLIYIYIYIYSAKLALMLLQKCFAILWFNTPARLLPSGAARQIRLRCAPNRRAARHVLLTSSDKCENIVVQDVLCTASAQGIARTTQADLVQQKPAVFLLY